MAKSKLIVFCIDALCSRDLEYMKTLPHFKMFFEKGSVVTNIENVYPSYTYPAHCSIITGNYVDKHGVDHNAILEIENDDAPWYNQRSDMKCETLLDVAKKNGYTTCSLSWPVTAGADFDYNMPMIVPAGYVGYDPIPWLIGNATQNLLDEYFWKFGRYLMGVDRSLDYFTMALAPEIIKDHQPDVMLVKMCDLDTVRHLYGIDNEQVKEQLRKHDAEFAVLLESVKRYSDFKNTNFVILGDHGQQDIKKHLNLNMVLKEHGFIRTDENNKITDYDAYCHSCSMSAWIELKNPEDEAMRKKIYEFLLNLKADPKYNLDHVLTKEEAKEKYHFSSKHCDFLVDGIEPMEFSATLKGEDPFKCYLPEGWHACIANHGHLPEKEEATTFMAFGPSVKEGVVVEKAKMVDEACTMAKMLGFDMVNTDGNEISEILK